MDTASVFDRLVRDMEWQDLPCPRCAYVGVQAHKLADGTGVEFRCRECQHVFIRWGRTAEGYQRFQLIMPTEEDTEHGTTV